MSKIRVAREGAVRTVTLTRAEKRNALDHEMLAGLKAAFAEPAAAERVVVLRAEGTVFCAGLDLTERRGTLSEPSGIEEMLHAIESFPLPVVAVVQGDAIAGGNELALHCDFVVAAATARFGMSLAQIGLAPTWFLAKKLLEVAGPVATREILLLGDPLPAARLHELGIIGRCVPPAELQTAARAVIDRLAANAPLSLKAMKALINREMAFRDAIPHADIDRQIVAARDSVDAREGIAARLERRKPSFVGR
ncbi:MAG: enoyl-CoA hydratase [Alphaproteobacteria bacterium]|nr:enoyl-CoA hydratase [Alphaproteobacteria bacterium]